MIHFKINLINSKSQIMVLNCVNKETEICINHMQFYESYQKFLESQDGPEIYRGPDFQTLNKVF
jgi:hypothetical protein